MICPICRQREDDEEKRQRLKEYTEEEYKQHLVDYHEYAPTDPPPAPTPTLEELAERVHVLEVTVAALVIEVEALRPPA